MFHSISKVNETCSLRNSIDNNNKDLRVGLRSITYTVGWYNIGEREYISWRRTSGADRLIVPPGLYNFKQLKELLESLDPIESVIMNKENGLIKISIENEYFVFVSEGLKDILGLNSQRLSGVVNGTSPVNFSKKVLYVYLEQINSNDNIVDGESSTLLACIGLDGCHCFGSIHTIRFSSPEYKLLQNGTIHEWKVTIKDEYKNILNNNNLPMYITLEIK